MQETTTAAPSQPGVRQTYLRVTRNGNSHAGYLIGPLSPATPADLEVGIAVMSELDDGGEFTEGDSITFTVVRFTAAEVAAMPDFKGW